MHDPPPHHPPTPCFPCCLPCRRPAHRTPPTCCQPASPTVRHHSHGAFPGQGQAPGRIVPWFGLVWAVSRTLSPAAPNLTRLAFSPPRLSPHPPRLLPRAAVGPARRLPVAAGHAAERAAGGAGHHLHPGRKLPVSHAHQVRACIATRCTDAGVALIPSQRMYCCPRAPSARPHAGPRPHHPGQVASGYNAPAAPTPVSVTGRAF